MAILTFDTLTYSADLQKAGFAREQADAMTKINANAFKTMIDASELATKSDLEVIKQELQANIAENNIGLEKAKQELQANITATKLELEKMKQELQANIINNRMELEKIIANTKHDSLKWAIGLMIAQTTLLVTAFGVGIAIFK